MSLSEDFYQAVTEFDEFLQSQDIDLGEAYLAGRPVYNEDKEVLEIDLGITNDGSIEDLQRYGMFQDQEVSLVSETYDMRVTEIPGHMRQTFRRHSAELDKGLEIESFELYDPESEINGGQLKSKRKKKCL